MRELLKEKQAERTQELAAKNIGTGSFTNFCVCDRELKMRELNFFVQLAEEVKRITYLAKHNLNMRVTSNIWRGFQWFTWI